MTERKLDSITNYFFTTTREAGQNLIDSGINKNRIHLVGNTMIDTLLKHRSRFQKPYIWNELNLSKNGFLVMTLHRPGNVDEEGKLKLLIDQIIEHSKIKKGSSEPNRVKVGSVSWTQVRAIAEDKMPDLNCFTVDSAMRMVAGTARSMGVTIKGGEAPKSKK